MSSCCLAASSSRQALLVLVADVVAVHGLVADDQPDHVGGVGQLGAAAPVHRQVEAGVEQEALQQRGRHLALERLVALVVLHDDLGLALQVGVLLRPAERVVDLGRRAQRREDVAVAAGVHRLHERDVGVDGLLVRGQRIGDQADRSDRALDGVQQRQAGEHPHGHFLLVGGQRPPRRDVVGYRNLFGQPEIAGQPVPDLGVFLVLQAVPVDRRDAVDQFHVAHWNPTSPGFRCVYSGSIARQPTLPLGCDNHPQHNIVCPRVAPGLPRRSHPFVLRHPEELVLGRLELARIAPVLPGHPAPQRPVDAVLVQVPATATAGVPDGVAELVLQFGVVPVLRAARRGERLRARSGPPRRSPGPHTGSAPRS